MPTYRIYELDDAARMFVPPIELDATNDLVAIEMAKLLVNGNAVDVWEQARHVGRLRPPPSRRKRSWFTPAREDKPVAARSPS